MQGPDLGRVKEHWEQFTGTALSEEDLARYGKQWRRDRLSVLQNGLSDDRRKDLEHLVAEVGPAADLTEARTKWGHLRRWMCGRR
jgi:hypothetical protein